MDTLQQVQLYQMLASLGKVAALDMFVSLPEFNQQLLSFEAHFKPYNPRKQGYNRYGLSITSQDGSFSHIPNLDSLSEYNKEYGTSFDESDFREWTPFFKTCKGLCEMLSPFHKYMGRSHILRLNKGGFSPPHRDSITLVPKHFRLLISFCHFDQYMFTLDNERILLNPGYLYCVNTRLVHSVFSFEDKSDFAVFNIDLCEESVRAVIDNLVFK